MILRHGLAMSAILLSIFYDIIGIEENYLFYY